MKVYRFGRYVVGQVFRVAVGYQISFGFHPLGPILGIWPHQAVPIINTE